MMVLRWSLGVALRARSLQHLGQHFIHTRPTISSRASALNRFNASNNLFTYPPFARSFGVCSPRSEPITTVRVPTMAESITEGTITQFGKQVGDFIEQDEDLATIETDKIDVSVNSPHYGVIKKLLVGEGDTVTVDQEIAEIQKTEQPTIDAKETTKAEPKEFLKERIEPSPTVPSPEPQPAQTPAPTPAPTPEPKTSTDSADTYSNHPLVVQKPKHHRDEERVKMTRIRQKTAQHLKASQKTAAFLTTFNEVDMSGIVEFRKKHRDAVLDRHGIKLGMMGAMARASVLALKVIPAVNASIENGDTVVYRDYVDLSVAAAIPKGLVTPVLRNIESMSIVEIEKGIAELVKKARDGKLTMDDLMGGSFTVSNSGIWGSLLGTPIINTPQTAVLGTYGIQDRPVAISGKVEIRPMMYIALTYDHRIIDGREAVTFLNLVKKYLEQPESMLLE